MHTSVQYIHKILIALLLFVFSERKKVPREHVPVSSSVLRDFRVTDHFFLMLCTVFTGKYTALMDSLKRLSVAFFYVFM